MARRKAVPHLLLPMRKQFRGLLLVKLGGLKFKQYHHSVKRSEWLLSRVPSTTFIFSRVVGESVI